MSVPNKSELDLILRTFETGLKVFNKKKSDFKAMASEAKKIVINSIDDKAAIKAASAMRRKLKAARCEITRQGKDIRQPLVNLTILITDRENELIDIIQPQERELQRQESWVKEEADRLEKQKREAEAARINDRINKLASFGFSVDTETLSAIDDETFAAVVAEAEKRFHAERIGRKEDQLSALHKQIEDIASDERTKIEAEDRCLMVDLNSQLQAAMNANDNVSDERLRLVRFALFIQRIINDHTPQMATEDGRDVIATASALLDTVYKMVLDAANVI